MTALRELARQNRDIEISNKAKYFANVARWLMIGKNTGNAVHAATGARARPEIIEAIKAASAAGTTTDGSFASPLVFQELSDAFLLSLRNIGVFDNALQFAIDAPLNQLIAITTLGASDGDHRRKPSQNNFADQPRGAGADSAQSGGDHRDKCGTDAQRRSEGDAAVSTGARARGRSGNGCEIFGRDFGWHFRNTITGNPVSAIGFAKCVTLRIVSMCQRMDCARLLGGAWPKSAARHTRSHRSSATPA